MPTRIEHDALGDLAVPEDALYGIHTARAIANFPLAHRPIRAELVHAYGAVKLACAQTNHEQGSLSEPLWNAISSACHEMMAGTLDKHIMVDALQGGHSAQLSSAACRVGAIDSADTARLRSRLTTMSLPSRPDLRLASFISLSLVSCAYC